MWKYVRKYLLFALLAGVFMVGEVLMDLLQPEIMSRIVDDGVLGVSTGGTGDMSLIWSLGLRMIALVLFGGFCGAMNNVFSHMSAQNIGNEVRKDAFRRIMTFSFLPNSLVSSFSRMDTLRHCTIPPSSGFLETLILRLCFISTVLSGRRF